MTLLVTLAAAGCGGSGEGAPSAADRPRPDATDRTGDSGGSPVKKPLSDVGEEAYSYDASDHGTFAVLFRKSGTWVAMTVVADRADNAGRLNELARTVAARI
ncbi:hypothetical protein [Streptomyces kebangsaanensis]|uniref:hypothetical protein n=1 Tax=Streptomyces kebangsaanensis TaxID=864058 RepID=UPI0011613F9A|nr:hypothetical protein [Streptomyces kebangsaanensis]